VRLDAEADVRSRMRQRLRFLYGETSGDQAHAALLRLLDRFGRSPPAHQLRAERFDERDVLLITYGDTIQSAGRAPLQVLNEFAQRHLQDLFSGIHVLPFYPYSSDYGFSVTDYLKVRPELGDWDDIAALQQRFKLMFDFVLNHVSAESEWFQAYLRGDPAYRGYFIGLDPDTDLSGVTRPRVTPVLTPFEDHGVRRWLWTTFSADQVDLNYANPEVLLRMIEVMLTYIERGAELLRMDAVGYLWKQVGTSCVHLPQTHEVVKLFRDVLDDVAPRVAIVTETNVPHRENVSYFGSGWDEAQMVYQFPLAPLVLDAFLHGDARRLADWAAGLTTRSASTTFLNFLASHDGIGVVPARGFLSDAAVEALVGQVRSHGGEVSFKTNPDGSDSPYELNTTFFDALSDPRESEEPWTVKRDRFLCSQAIMLALAGVPGVYIHSLFGSHNDHALYASTGWKRDLNHGRLELAEVEGRLADREGEAGQVYWRYAQLLRTRRGHTAFHPQSPQEVVDAGPGVFGLRRGPWKDDAVLALHNVSRVVQRVPGLHEGGVDLISGRRIERGAPIALEPYEIIWLKVNG
jgi:sucrose phosphorylase